MLLNNLLYPESLCRKQFIWQVEKRCSKVWCQKSPPHCHCLLVPFLELQEDFFYWVGKINPSSGVRSQPGVITENSTAGFFKLPGWNCTNLVLNPFLLLFRVRFRITKNCSRFRITTELLSQIHSAVLKLGKPWVKVIFSPVPTFI